MAQIISETVQRVKEFINNVPNGGSGGKMKNSTYKRRSG